MNLGDLTFHLTSGQQTSKKVVAVDGAPTIKVVDSNGIAYVLPLTRTRTKKNSHTHLCTFYNNYRVPDHPLVPRALVGGTTSIRLNSTADEREAKPHQRRTRALRPISEADPDFDRLSRVSPKTVPVSGPDLNLHQGPIAAAASLTGCGA